MDRFPLLYRLTKKDLKVVSENFILTKHARTRLKERFNFEKYGGLRNAIVTSPIAFVENDGALCVGTKDGSALKFLQPSGGRNKNKFLMITIHEPSINNNNLWKKYKLTLRGHNR